MYTPLKISPVEFGLSKSQLKIIKDLAQELKLIEERLPFIKEIVARGGFILDTLFGVPPNDIDLFYSLKTWQSPRWQGCRCEEIKSKILKLNLPLSSTRKIDTGHILKGEIYLDPIQKITGPFSHHIDVPSMVCLTSTGDLWSNQEALNCIQTKTHEIRFDGWLQHTFYPYSDQKPNFPTGYAKIVIVRGLRMIHTKKYKAVGPNFRYMVENCPEVLDAIVKSRDLQKRLIPNLKEKCHFMKPEDFKNALRVTGVKNQKAVFKKIEQLLKL